MHPSSQVPRSSLGGKDILVIFGKWETQKNVMLSQNLRKLAFCLQSVMHCSFEKIKQRSFKKFVPEIQILLHMLLCNLA